MLWEYTLQQAISNLPDTTAKGTKLSVGQKEISFYVTPKEEEINCAENWNPDRSHRKAGQCEWLRVQF